ncbi:Orf92 [Heliothis zea nudivirus]|uniref:Orf92 n=1 Tax=Heliothis zea nudivirus 1 TaxID=3116536 RepID=Q8JKM1_9VIRU|nr:Orf92 [Heliothis zea nudivirus]AAN04386.1 Orf92 [Heliothis zea nudivirus]
MYTGVIVRFKLGTHLFKLARIGNMARIHCRLYDCTIVGIFSIGTTTATTTACTLFHKQKLFNQIVDILDERLECDRKVFLHLDHVVEEKQCTRTVYVHRILQVEFGTLVEQCVCTIGKEQL